MWCVEEEEGTKMLVSWLFIDNLGFFPYKRDAIQQASNSIIYFYKSKKRSLLRGTTNSLIGYYKTSS